MSTKEWKDGFEAGIDFALTFVNEQCNTKHEGFGAIAAELNNLIKIKEILKEHLEAKEQS